MPKDELEVQTNESGCVVIKATPKTTLILIAILSSVFTGGAISVPQWLLPHAAPVEASSIDTNSEEHRAIRDRLSEVEKKVNLIPAFEKKLDFIADVVVESSRRRR